MSTFRVVVYDLAMREERIFEVAAKNASRAVVKVRRFVGLCNVNRIEEVSR